MGEAGVEPTKLEPWILLTAVLLPPMAMGFEPISACSTSKYFDQLN